MGWSEVGATGAVGARGGRRGERRVWRLAVGARAAVAGRAAGAIWVAKPAPTGSAYLWKIRVVPSVGYI